MGPFYPPPVAAFSSLLDRRRHARFPPWVVVTDLIPWPKTRPKTTGTASQRPHTNRSFSIYLSPYICSTSVSFVQSLPTGFVGRRSPPHQQAGTKGIMDLVPRPALQIMRTNKKGFTSQAINLPEQQESFTGYQGMRIWPKFTMVHREKCPGKLCRTLRHLRRWSPQRAPRSSYYEHYEKNVCVLRSDLCILSRNKCFYVQRILREIILSVYLSLER